MLKMKQRSRIYYSDAQKELMWQRWQKSDSMNAIGRLFARLCTCLNYIYGQENVEREVAQFVRKIDMW